MENKRTCDVVMYVFMIIILCGCSCAQVDVNTVYRLLSNTFDTLNLELNIIRNELLTTKQELAETKATVALLLNQKTMIDTSTTVQEETIQASETETSNEYLHFATRIRRTIEEEKVYTRNIETRVLKELNEMQRNMTGLADNNKKHSTDLDLVRLDVDGQQKQLQTLNSDINECLVSTKSLAAEIKGITTHIGHMSTTQTQTATQIRAELSSYKEEIEEKIDVQERCKSGYIHKYSHPNMPFPYTATVYFDPPFKTEPSIVYGTTYLDSSKDTYLRYSITQTELTNHYVKILMRTYHDTVVFGQGFSWMACPK